MDNKKRAQREEFFTDCDQRKKQRIKEYWSPFNEWIANNFEFVKDATNNRSELITSEDFCKLLSQQDGFQPYLDKHVTNQEVVLAQHTFKSLNHIFWNGIFQIYTRFEKESNHGTFPLKVGIDSGDYPDCTQIEAFDGPCSREQDIGSHFNHNPDCAQVEAFDGPCSIEQDIGSHFKPNSKAKLNNIYDMNTTSTTTSTTTSIATSTITSTTTTTISGKSNQITTTTTTTTSNADRVLKMRVEKF
ncbi:hypothetical protein PPL_11877 [Heterostelium album PN500]|uniref:Uncharacterized protein n=1 Tax=Heterostelium pallidum (strain ATCC 26659 / Pp 5 / PN500) TaxID=670386 RepID=D3BUQ6_HETP5|nr:hypothetical protein PPL_11877 [Heterostelium album PN500]EFA74844.1 hypothetical protein PPL_11877 [Heterostelium album PN500]|eukprot:XP_020426978.1 hypothetical protein PPL_11877 [Heterostelium album PN500]